MKITAYDPEHPYRLGTGTTLGTESGGDLSGSMPSPTVVAIQGTSVSSNTPGAVGDVLTIVNLDPALAMWATPSNAGGGTPSPLTTKGDLYTYTTTNARLAVGSNGTGLIADSTAIAGVRWTLQALSGELLMQDGVTSPPVPLETELGNDWLYADL